VYIYYAEHCPLSNVYLIHTKFQELALLLTSEDWLSLQ